MYLKFGVFVFPGFHEVDVTAQRVDLAVVRNVAHRVRALPARECVRREPSHSTE